MDPELAQAIAMINAQVSQGQLDLNRDIYQNIQLPTYRNVTFPTSYGQNTGYLPADYPGPYAGMPTFGNISGMASLFGDAGYDPRLAALGYTPGSLTVAGQAQRLAEEQARAQQQQFAQTLGMAGFNADQARFNDYTNQANKDRQYALDINADPNSIVAGQILPDWLKPHAEWARQFASQNGGRLPTSQDLRTVLAGSGRTIEDYMPGGRFAGSNSNATVEPLGGQPGQPGMSPAAGPVSSQPQALVPVSTGGVSKLNADYLALIKQKGVPYLSYNDPDLQRIYQQDLGGDAATNLQRAQALSDWSRAHPGQTPDASTQLQLYQGTTSPDADVRIGPMPGEMRQAAPADDPNARIGPLEGPGMMMQRSTGEMMASRDNPLLARANTGMPQSGGGGVANAQAGAGQAPATDPNNPYWAAMRGAGAPAGPGGYSGVSPLSGPEASFYMPGGGQQLGGGGLTQSLMSSGGFGGQQQYGGNAMMASPEMMRNPMMNYQRAPGAYGGQQPFNVNYTGSGNTGQIGYGQAMSLDQRRLIEQGRQTDIQAQLNQNAQRIQQQYQQGQLGLQGQQNRLAREQAYGGSGYLGSGQTLADRAQQQQTALQALQQESQLRADPFQLAQYRYGLNNAGINNVIGAVAGSGVLPTVQGGHGAAPQAPTMQNQIGQAGGYPTFGQGQGGMASAQQQMAALPQLNQINGRNYLRAGAGGQNYVNSAYKAAGLAGNDQDVTEAVQRGLPQYARRGVPTFGRVAA